MFPEVGVRGSGGLGHSRLGLFLPSSGTEQMLSHGTADVVLEACTDFWDGADIYPLSGSDRWVRRHMPGPVVHSPAICLPARLAHGQGGISGRLASLLPHFPDRKKVLDFYQRACLSGYCSAFAYKPMSCALSSQLNGKCIELVQAPGQSSIFTMCELPSTVPIKLSTRSNSWSSDGTVHVRPGAGAGGAGEWGGLLEGRGVCHTRGDSGHSVQLALTAGDVGNSLLVDR